MKRTTLLLPLLVAAALNARADVITDWNVKSGEIITEAKMGTPPAVRVMAVVQTAAYEAARTLPPGASMEAAVAAAHHAALAKLIPSQQAMIDAAYAAALAPIAEGSARSLGIEAGHRAAAAVLAQRAGDAVAPESYRPHAAAGAYVPTATPAVPTWSSRKPWVMSSAAQFRPGPPPALGTSEWARDYNEVKALGAKASTARSPEQADIAKFWEYSMPSIYFGVVRSAANAPGRDVVKNARLYAAVAQAMDDAMISVFEAKYHYAFWRPATAIRNGDMDGNDATERDAAWAPLVDAPLHPEYPSGHGILAGAVAAILQADLGNKPVTFSTTSPTAKGAQRKWTSLSDFTNEVGMSRIYAGIHYRTATEVATSMGRQIGELAAKQMGMATGSSLQASR